MQPLKLTIRAIRALQEKHGISNLLQPTEGDAVKMACLDFVADFYHEGSRGWEKPPTPEEIEETPIGDVLQAVKQALSGEAPAGKD